MNRNELRKLMDCCRADSHDLAEPEMSALAESLEQDPGVRDELRAIHAWDAKIGRALHDVPVPAGLAERMLDATARVGAESAEAVKGPPLVEGVRSTVELAELRRRRRRIMWPAGLVAGLAAAAALILMIGRLAGWGDDLTSTQVVVMARDWARDLDQARWEPPETAPSGYPLGRWLRFPPVGWQRFQALEDARAVAYVMEVPPDHSQAYLLVIPTRQGRYLPNFPRDAPDSTTGNVCVGVWKSDGCLYVLVVQGGVNNYRRVLRSQALAIAPPTLTRPAAAA